MMLSPWAWIGLAPLVALPACDLCACTPLPPDPPTHISGLVRAATGEPVGATVMSGVNREGCGFAVPGAAATQPAADATDPNGKYDLLIVSANQDVVCLRLVAHRAEPADSTVRDSIRFVPGVAQVLDFTFP